MSYVNISSVNPSKLRDIKSTGLLLRKGESENLFLIAASKNQVMFVVLSAGENQFVAHPITPDTTATGLFISQIEIEVDLESVVDRYNGEPKTGCLQIDGGCAQILATMNNRGIPQRIPIPFMALEGSEDGPKTAFKAWRIVHVVADERIPLFEHGASVTPVFA